LQRPDWPDPNLHRGWKELLPQMSAYGSMVLGRFRSIGKRRSQPHLTTAAFSWKCSFPWVKYWWRSRQRLGRVWWAYPLKREPSRASGA